jgi:uncharacterized protein YggE
MKLTSVRKVAALCVAIALISAAGLSTPASAADTRYITISATGSTNVLPDAVRITATVSVVGKTSKEALAAASTSSSAVRKALTANKIATKDVATQSVSVFPEYTYPANGTPVLSGYRASQSFDIIVRAASTAGEVVDVIVDAGGDNLQVNSASPFVLDYDKAIQTARASAVARAKAKANSYAKLLGVKLGKVIYLDETSTPAPFPIYSAAAKAEDSATQIDLGEQKVTVSVTVRWYIF